MYSPPARLAPAGFAHLTVYAASDFASCSTSEPVAKKRTMLKGMSASPRARCSLLMLKHGVTGMPSNGYSDSLVLGVYLVLHSLCIPIESLSMGAVCRNPCVYHQTTRA
ncbi:hypothetical protein COCSADRAFT_274755 [Bipolaris sorokiniana ND90Pr]|uniref:Uncharacterized protein n=1 Tax=Cochliobolus sativus (strain ND90Pr / ATCC 201652) TaxID=665912 RepID=M2TIV6_COCSN|nr:uncharacterized protein COCSADRAFT_274755 [Bipolaris sorokiniana ND90Pr]EMD68632.1 hypothetical protein COCSADRAFT_274755 [Bipolaris sorokiniana ND90Pr]